MAELSRKVKVLSKIENLTVLIESDVMEDYQEISQLISVVIPALNESASLGDVIVGCQKYTNDILVIDGHSRDSTAQVARALGARVILDNKKGKGDAIRCAIPHLQRQITVFIDADGSHETSDIPKLIKPILEEGADHVSASRLSAGSSETHGGFAEVAMLTGSSFITACINHRFRVRLFESQNGYRAVRTEVLKALGLRENISTIDQEMIIKTLKKGYRMAEVPSHEYPRKAGYSKVKVGRMAFRYVYSMMKYLYF